jgi:histone-lysine N-methyltransferase SETMAR
VLNGLSTRTTLPYTYRLAGVIHVDFLTDARTVNAAYYSDLLATDVKEKIRSNRKTGGKRVAFIQDDAHPHTAKITMETLRKLKWNLLTHPPYSPDLAPSDFYLFGRLKSDLQGMRFADNDAVIQTVRSGYAANHKTFLKRASGCFQNVGKNVLTPEGSTLKSDMCK